MCWCEAEKKKRYKRKQKVTFRFIDVVPWEGGERRGAPKGIVGIFPCAPPPLGSVI
jgi:hypothetical protein